MPRGKRDEVAYFGRRIAAIDRQIQSASVALEARIGTLKTERKKYEEAQAVFKPARRPHRKTTENNKK